MHSSIQIPTLRYSPTMVLLVVLNKHQHQYGIRRPTGYARHIMKEISCSSNIMVPVSLRMLHTHSSPAAGRSALSLASRQAMRSRRDWLIWRCPDMMSLTALMKVFKPPTNPHILPRNASHCSPVGGAGAPAIRAAFFLADFLVLGLGGLFIAGGGLFTALLEGLLGDLCLRLCIASSEASSSFFVGLAGAAWPLSLGPSRGTVESPSWTATFLAIFLVVSLNFHVNLLFSGTVVP